MITKVKKYYSNLSEPVKASLWFMVSNVIQKGIALLSTPIFTRLMTTEQYGVFSVYQSWYSIVLILTTLNLYAGVFNNGMIKWPDKRDQFTSSVQGISTTLTIIWFLVYVFAIDFWNNLLGLSTLFVLAMLLECLFINAYMLWAARQRYEYKYKKLVAVSLLVGILSPVVGAVSVCITEYKAEARVLSFVLIQVIVGMVFYIFNLHKGKQFFNKVFWEYALLFNIPLIPHYLSQTVLNQADRIMISDIVGKSEAAIYSVAYTISTLFSIVINAINNTFIPYTYKSIQSKKLVSLRNSTNTLVLLVGAACVAVMAFGPEIIRFFAAPEYYEARWIIPPVAEAVFFMFIYPLFCNVEFFYEKNKLIMVASVIAALTNIGLNLVAIRWFGYIAAAYTTLICYIVLCVVHYWAYKRIWKSRGDGSELYDHKFILLISVVSLMFMIGITIIYDIVIARYAVLLSICICAFAKRKAIIDKFKEIKR